MNQQNDHLYTQENQNKLIGEPITTSEHVLQSTGPVQINVSTVADEAIRDFKLQIFNARARIRKAEGELEKSKEQVKKAKADLEIRQAELDQLLDSDVETGGESRPENSQPIVSPGVIDEVEISPGGKIASWLHDQEKGKAFTVGAICKATELEDRIVKRELLLLGDKGYVKAVGQRFEYIHQEQPAKEEQPGQPQPLKDWLAANPIEKVGAKKIEALCGQFETVDDLASAVTRAVAEGIEVVSIMPKGISAANVEGIKKALESVVISGEAIWQKVLGEVSATGENWTDLTDPEHEEDFNCGRQAFSDKDDWRQIAEAFRDDLKSLGWLIRGWYFEKALNEQPEQEPAFDIDSI